MSMNAVFILLINYHICLFGLYEFSICIHESSQITIPVLYCTITVTNGTVNILHVCACALFCGHNCLGGFGIRVRV